MIEMRHRVRMNVWHGLDMVLVVILWQRFQVRSQKIRAIFRSLVSVFRERNVHEILGFHIFLWLLEWHFDTMTSMVTKCRVSRLVWSETKKSITHGGTWRRTFLLHSKLLIWILIKKSRNRLKPLIGKNSKWQTKERLLIAKWKAISPNHSIYIIECLQSLRRQRRINSFLNILLKDRTSLVVMQYTAIIRVLEIASYELAYCLKFSMYIKHNTYFSIGYTAMLSIIRWPTGIGDWRSVMPSECSRMRFPAGAYPIFAGRNFLLDIRW